MKKMLFAAIALLLAAAPAAQAQKVNEAALRSKIEKSDADIADAKKSAKAATWLNRGKAFYEAAQEPTKSLFVGVDMIMLKMAMGDPASTEEVTLLDVPYKALVYPYVTVYLRDDKVATWKQTREVMPDAVAKSLEAYNKAYELDPKTADKVKAGLKQLSDYCSQLGNVGLETGEYKTSAEAYKQAYEIQSSPAYGEADPALLYYAGYLQTVNGSQDPAAFVDGAVELQKALDLGYADEEGNIYYYLYHCYYGQKDQDPANVMKAKEVLLTGIEKFPKNERILDGLMQLYTSEEGVGDPADLVTMIDKAIEENPQNIDLWFGRGRIFNALKNYDEAIASFKKVAELAPQLFEGNYCVGAFIAIKGDALNTEMNQKQYSSQAAYDADLKSVNEVYMSAIPWFEKAHEIKPEDVNTLDFLKSICFRLRDEAGMMDLYNKYNELFKQAKGE